MDCFDLDHVVSSLADQLQVRPGQVRAAVSLLEDGNTLPFIARYRKEATRSLDEAALRAIEDGLAQAREIAARKATILKTIDEQGQLDDALRGRILACHDKRSLEDIYLPFKPRRRTRAAAARERGLQELADLIAAQSPLSESRRTLLSRFVDPAAEVATPDDALQGALDIIAEEWSEDAEMRAWLTAQCQQHGRVRSQVKRGKRDAGSKYETYFEHSEPVGRIASHRFLAMKRGEADGFLKVSVQLEDDTVLRHLKVRLVRREDAGFRRDLLRTVEDCYQRLLLPSVESAVLQTLKEYADAEAIAVFAKNLRELLLAPPAGRLCALGLDPGYRTGCKLAVVDETGKHLEHAAIYPTPPRRDVRQAAQVLGELIRRHDVRLVAIGNGTASREADQFVRQLVKDEQLEVDVVVVSEAGASIYSASELAAGEYPELDVTVRGAISIAHRLQDPLAELVKIDPKSIGVGQYQHDVNQPQLKRALDREVESCVNSVGVDLNTASASLLSHVSGIGPKLAERIVAHRDQQGRFDSRRQLLDVPKLGPKALEQAAGFLRIHDGAEPLDRSGVHPESYHVVARMAKSLGKRPEQLIGSEQLVAALDAESFVDEQTGLPTVQDILDELRKPGRDPRKKFRAARFQDDVTEIGDLKPGMVLEGSVTNVTHFGAFVDLGVHQDGLIHVSQIANEFIKDPSEVLSVGDIVRVQVLDVDQERRRISLSRKSLLG